MPALSSSTHLDKDDADYDMVADAPEDNTTSLPPLDLPVIADDDDHPRVSREPAPALAKSVMPSTLAAAD